MALCCLLAFWTGGDRTQMKQLFRQSGLLREKWDEVHYADGSTYGKTIERAIATTSEFYDPDDRNDTTDDTPGGSSPDGASSWRCSRSGVARICREEPATERARRRTRGDTIGKPSASTLSKRRSSDSLTNSPHVARRRSPRASTSLRRVRTVVSRGHPPC